MSDPKETKRASDVAVYFRLLAYVKPYWFWFLISIIGYAFFAYSQPMYAKMVEYFLKALETSTGTPVSIPFWGNMEQAKLIFFVPIALLFIAAFAGIGSFFGSYYLVKVSMNVVNNLRRDLFERLLSLPCEYFDNRNSGHLLSKITYNSTQVTGAATEAIKVVIREGLTVAFLLGYLVYTQWKLTLVFLVLGPVIAIVVSTVGKRFRRMSHRIQDSMGDVTHVASETISNYRVVRGFGGDSYEKGRFFSACARNLRQSLKMNKLNAISTPVLRFLVMVALAFMMYIALYMKSSGAIGTTPGELVAFLTAAGMLPKPIRQLSEIYGDIQKGIAAAESIFELLDYPPEKNNGTYTTERAEGRIEVKNLSFSYGESEKPALEHVSFSMEPGQTVALVGKSGSGKTTLTSLLPRFYEFNDGEILLDGMDIRKYDLANLRHQIAMVDQKVNLFTGTLKTNIAYGVTEISDEDVRLASQSAYASDFIDFLPDGYNTLIGENGIKLSGGQRQRVAIARALFKDAPVLILDEATSALDTESERHIQAAMDEAMKSRTTLVIAHRLSTIENADKILVLDKGRIVESGTHQELLKLGGLYASLYKIQFSQNQPYDHSNI